MYPEKMKLVFIDTSCTFSFWQHYLVSWRVSYAQSITIKLGMKVGNYYGNNDETNMLVTLENELHAYL